ncbi:uncharacterized protein LOC143198014 [Rhynchophorus ferrugineus]|uniref:uncharacterized protein LOC143198014 n=1 Tax=Rhynchophorus ferrugineus TaxID=354439 RepID=UPI003FCD155B
MPELSKPRIPKRLRKLFGFSKKSGFHLDRSPKYKHTNTHQAHPRYPKFLQSGILSYISNSLYIREMIRHKYRFHRGIRAIIDPDDNRVSREVRKAVRVWREENLVRLSSHLVSPKILEKINR